MSENTRIFGKALKDFNNSSENFNLDVSNMTAALSYDGTEVDSFPNPAEFIEELRKTLNLSMKEVFSLAPDSPQIMSASKMWYSNTRLVLTTDSAVDYTVAWAAGVVALAVAAVFIPVLGTDNPEKDTKLFKRINRKFLGELIKSAREKYNIKFAGDVTTQFISQVRDFNGVENYE